MLPKHDYERAYKLHRQKLETIKPSLNNDPPKQYPHLVYRNKQIQNEEDKLSQVDHENKILLHKMTQIMKHGGRVDNRNDQPVKRQVDPYRKQKHEAMLSENVQIAKRLEAIKSTYHRESWEEDYKKHEQYLTMRESKEYEGGSQRKKRGKKDEYENDFESDEEEKHSNNRQKEKDRQKDKKCDSGKTSPRDGDLDLSHTYDMYWGENKEGEDQSNDKKATSRSEKSGSDQNHGQTKTKDGKSKQDRSKDKEEDKKDLQGDRDIKQLFKLSENLLDSDEAVDVLIKTLVKKSHKQRMEVKAKFKEKYNLDLDTKLKDGLGEDWNVIIDSLLTEQDLADTANLHNAIQNKNIGGIVEIIGTKDNNSLSALKDVYRKEYSKSVESAISENTEEPVELLLVTLAKTGKDESTEVDGKTAQKDAVELYESGDGRWTTASGKFIKLVDSKSVAHIKTVLTLYKQVSGGKEALDSVKSECPADYAEAVNSYVNCTKDPQNFYAEKLFKNVGSSNPEFVNTLVARSEIDLPAVCKSYKKKYDADIKEDIDDKCKPQTSKVLKALASKTPNSKTPKSKKGGSDGKPGSKKTSSENGGPTVKAADNFNPDDDCERLRKAMEGFGTDEQTIIDIICSKNNSQRQTLKQKYAEKYNQRDLITDLKSELSGDFEEVILGLMMTPSEYDVHCFHESLSGAGTDENMLTTLLATKTPAEMKSIKAEYKKVYEKELDKAIQSDTSGDFRDFLLELCKGDRPQGSTVNKKEAEEDARKIHMDGKGKPDDDIFKTLMTKKNPAQVKATFDEYKKISGKDIYETMKKNLKGDAKDAYIIVGKVGSVDQATFYTEQLKDAADGLGTNDASLIRIIVTRSEIDLGNIKEKYKKNYKKSVKDMVEGECSGDYKKALLILIGENDYDGDDEANSGKTKTPKGSPQKSKSIKTAVMASSKANSKSSNKTKDKKDELKKDEKAENKKKDGSGDKKGEAENKKKDGSGDKKREAENKKKDGSGDKKGEAEKKGKDDGKKIEQEKKSRKENTGKVTNDNAEAKNKTDAKNKSKENKDNNDKKEDVSIDDELERLYKAMDGFGTDEQIIIDVIVSKKNEKRQELRKKYEERYTKDLMADLKSELSGDLQEVILGLMMTSSEYDVDCLHEAMAGMGTDESMLIGVLATKNPEEMQKIKDAYKTAYKKDLEKDIKSETSGDFKELLLELLKGQRPQGDTVDDKLSQEEANKLYKDGKGKIDMKMFKSIFINQNASQVKAIFSEYVKVSGKDAYQVIDENLKGDAKTGYTCLLKSCDGPEDYYVERLHDAFDGLGTNDSRLIRIVVSRSEIDLPAIKEKYKEIHGKSLSEKIQSECSGDYKKALLVVVGDE